MSKRPVNLLLEPEDYRLLLDGLLDRLNHNEGDKIADRRERQRLADLSRQLVRAYHDAKETT